MPNLGDLYIGGIPVTSSPSPLIGYFQLSATGPGAIYSLTVLNFDTSNAKMVMLLDQTANPSGYSTTAVQSIFSGPIAAGSSSTGPGYFSPGQFPPMQFKNGLWVVLSTVLTTAFSCTTDSGANGQYFAQVITG